MKKTLFIAFFCGLLILSVLSGSTKRLQFNADGSFKILQLTDMHFGENEVNDLLSMALQTFLINSTNPDFVALTGDQVSGYAWDQTTTSYQRNWIKYTLPMQLAQKDYALILGNHDAQANLNRSQIMELDMMNEFSHSKKSPDGVSEGSNYHLKIMSHYNESHASAVLWFLDSHDTGCGNTTSGWGCIDQSQIDWFNKEFDKLDAFYGTDVLHLMFIHIPLEEYVTLYNTQAVYGNRGENVGCPQVNTGFFEVMSQRGIKASFCGHDHNNDYGGVYKGVELVYGRKSCFGGYGPPKDIIRGGRILELKESYDVQSGKVIAGFSHKIVQGDGTFIENGDVFFRDDKVGSCADTSSLDRRSK